MKVTLDKLLSSQKGFEELGSIKAGKISSSLAFDLAELTEQVNAIFKSYNKIITDLREKYSTANEDGELEIKDGSQNEKDFVKEVMGIQDREYDLNFPAIKKEDLIKDGVCLISVGALSSILWMINKDKKDGN